MNISNPASCAIEQTPSVRAVREPINRGRIIPCLGRPDSLTVRRSQEPDMKPYIELEVPQWRGVTLNGQYYVWVMVANRGAWDLTMPSWLMIDVNPAENITGKAPGVVCQPLGLLRAGETRWYLFSWSGQAAHSGHLWASFISSRTSKKQGPPR